MLPQNCVLHLQYFKLITQHDACEDIKITVNPRLEVHPVLFQIQNFLVRGTSKVMTFTAKNSSLVIEDFKKTIKTLKKCNIVYIKGDYKPVQPNLCLGKLETCTRG